jgi:hypothetical protein
LVGLLSLSLSAGCRLLVVAVVGYCCLLSSLVGYRLRHCRCLLFGLPVIGLLVG